MSVLSRDVTAPWESDCRRCHVRLLGAFDANGQGVNLEALPVVGGDVELRRLEVGFRAVPVRGDETTERYIRHECAKPAPERGATPPTGPMRMPFGKHRGLLVTQLPRGYVRWAVENLDFREPALKRALESVLHSNPENP